MPEYLSPGVYVEEVETGAMTIEGVSTSTAGFLGQTERGPVEPQFVSTFAEFKRIYGGFARYRRGEPLEDTNLAYAVNGFFRNGGQRCWIGRVTAATETADMRFGSYSPPMALVASTDEIAFGRVVTGLEETATVQIRHGGIANDPEIDISSISVLTPGGDPSGEFDVTLPEGEETPQTVQPGDSLRLEVSYQPTATGNHTGILTVDYDGADPPLEVALAGTGATGEFSIDSTAVDFGTVPLNTAQAESITVTNTGLPGADSVVITGVSLQDGPGSAAPFTITNEPEVTGVSLAAGESVTVTVEIDHDTAADVDALLEIEYDVGTTSTTEQLPVRARVVDPQNTLGASRREIAFGDIVTTTTVTETVVVRNMGAPTDQPLEITNVEVTTGGGFTAALVTETVPTVLEPGASTTVQIEFAPDTATTHTGTVTITYDDGTGTPTTEIEVSGDGEDVGGLYQAEPPATEGLTYDDVVVGEHATQTILLENTAPEGAEIVTIDNIELTDDGEEQYTLPEDIVPADPNDPFAELDPAESFPVPVTVIPERAEQIDGELEIEYQDRTTGGGTTTETVALTTVAVEPMVDVRAVGPGDWGGRVAITIRNGGRGNDTFRLTVQYWSNLDPVVGTDEEVIEAQETPDAEETFTELTTRESSTNYYEKVINNGSNLIEVERLGPTRPANGTSFLGLPQGSNTGEFTVGLPDYRGSDEDPPGERTGLAGFAEIDDISILNVPDENAIDGLTAEIVDHCQDPNLQDRFAILQTEQGADPADLPPESAISDYAAIYHPHIRILDPETNVRKLVPPGGHVAGVYARSDAEEGVHKAPANETVRGAVELEMPVTTALQDRLNPKGVNAIRSFKGRGIRVWGARTTSDNPLWKYVNVRRLFLYIEESIDEGTQWAVFESNTEALWARVRQSVSNFLEGVWRDGGLAGSTPEEAFYVKADRSTMTETEIDQGKLIVEVGVRPSKTAEFVIFRITQKMEGEGGA